MMLIMKIKTKTITITVMIMIMITLYNNNFTLFSYIKYTNIQISHHLQIARLIEAGGVWKA